MSGPLHVYYGPEIQRYYFGQRHPFNQRRVELSVELMRACGVFDTSGNTLRPLRQASVEEALLFHSPRYMSFLERASERGEGYLDCGDTPAFPGCLDAALWGVGGTLAALEAVMEGEGHAYAVGGGYHHAHRESASGFCILNDAAIAFELARSRYGVRSALYLDIDVHHGDGVFYGFVSDPWLLDVDLHQDGRTLFPGTGFEWETGGGDAAGLKLNLPFPPGAADDSALLAWREAAEPAIRAFRPELIIMQCGADAHGGDPLASLEWTTGPYLEIARSVHALSHELCEGRLLLLGGGGYNPANVCLAWTAIGMIAGEAPVPERTPEDWRDAFEREYRTPAPTHFREAPTASPLALEETRRSVETLRRRSHLLWTG
jgi:acetoin utilization protein AcuC